MALGNACFTRARFEEAADFYRRSLEPRRIMGDRWGLGNSLDNLSITEYFLGRWSEAWEHGVLARNLRQELKDRPGCTESALNLGNLLAVLGREVEARTLYDEALSLAAEAADIRRQARAHLGLGCLDLWAGHRDASLSRCETVRNMNVEEPAISSRRLLIEALALANPAIPDPAGIITGLVTAKLKAAMAAAELAESMPDICAVLLAEARELLARGEREEAHRKCTDVLARVEGGRIPILEMVALAVLEAARSVEEESSSGRIEALARHLESQLPDGNGSLKDFRKPVFPLP
jgi:tetratricopeptide (TPR) repeat protein